MKKSQLEMCCSVCDERVTTREDFCINDSGNTIHAECYLKRILQENSWLSATAA